MVALADADSLLGLGGRVVVGIADLVGGDDASARRNACYQVAVNRADASGGRSKRYRVARTATGRGHRADSADNYRGGRAKTDSLIGAGGVGERVQTNIGADIECVRIGWIDVNGLDSCLNRQASAAYCIPIVPTIGAFEHLSIDNDIEDARVGRVHAKSR